MLKPVFIHNTGPNLKPKFVQTAATTYTVGSKLASPIKTWEHIKDAHDSVHILVADTETEELLFVKQVRIPVLVRDQGNGEVTECCAGIIDHYQSAFPERRSELVARDEIKEELGYEVPTNKLLRIKELKSSVGTAGTTAHTFYTEVTPKEFVGQHLTRDEDIEVIRVPFNDVESFMGTATTDAVTMFLVQWWLIYGER